MVDEPAEANRQQQQQQERTKTLLAGERVLVTVEAALPDIVVVSLKHGSKSFQGALLDATKRVLPCGVQLPEPIAGQDSDVLSNVAARFSYFQDKKQSTPTKFGAARQSVLAQLPLRSRNARPTVRLRPRQVLCNKCRSICNENSENVDRKRKVEEQRCTERPSARRRRRRSERQQRATATRPCQRTRSQRLTDKVAVALADRSDEEPSSVEQSSSESKADLAPEPRELEITAQEAARAFEENGFAKKEIDDDDDNDDNDDGESESARVPSEEEDEVEKGDGRILRNHGKKYSIGLMEDLWEESVLEETPSSHSGLKDHCASVRATPVIKISFGAQGEGTVLKIPPKIQRRPTCGSGLTATDTDDEEEPPPLEPERDPLELSPIVNHIGSEDGDQEQLDPQRLGLGLLQGTSAKDCDVASAKAARRALKKAKKKALKRLKAGLVSPARSPCSPRYNLNFDVMALRRRRKHKVKHKKRHREERKHKSPNSRLASFVAAAQLVKPIDVNVQDCGQSHRRRDAVSACAAIKEQCLKQKVSITLERLNKDEYDHRHRHHHHQSYPAVNGTSSGCKTAGIMVNGDAEGEDEDDTEDEDLNCEQGPRRAWLTSGSQRLILK